MAEPTDEVESILAELRELRDKWFRMADLHDCRRHPNARPDIWYDVARKEDAQELRDVITKIEMGEHRD